MHFPASAKRLVYHNSGFGLPDGREEMEGLLDSGQLKTRLIRKGWMLAISPRCGAKPGVIPKRLVRRLPGRFCVIVGRQ